MKAPKTFYHLTAMLLDAGLSEKNAQRYASSAFNGVEFWSPEIVDRLGAEALNNRKAAQALINNASEHEFLADKLEAVVAQIVRDINEAPSP